MTLLLLANANRRCILIPMLTTLNVFMRTSLNLVCNLELRDQKIFSSYFTRMFGFDKYTKSNNVNEFKIIREERSLLQKSVENTVDNKEVSYMNSDWQVINFRRRKKMGHCYRGTKTKMCLKSRMFKSYLYKYAISMVLLSFLIKISIPALSTMPSQCCCLPTREHFVIVMQFCFHTFFY